MCLTGTQRLVAHLTSAHEAQLLNYLRATEIEVGMLFSFGLKPEFKRLAFDNARKQRRRTSKLFGSLLTTIKRTAIDRF